MLASLLIFSSSHFTKWTPRLLRDILFHSKYLRPEKRVLNVHERVARSRVDAPQEEKPDEALALLKRISFFRKV
jgi:hypothetical protein